MKMRFSLLFLLVFFLSGSMSAQFVTVDENYTAQQLVDSLFQSNPCAQGLNGFASGMIQNSGGSIGYFSYTGPDFPFEKGIVLTTGRADRVTGPNTSLLSDGAGSWDGDTDLEAALDVGDTTNATALEFDFLPFASEISFEYLFSSEQYLSNPASFQCNFTDGFAFLLREAGTQDQYQNLALIPGTFTPVKVNTVRDATEKCPGANEEWFDKFNGSFHPTNFNGQTKVMKAVANVTPGVLYHLKLVVADEGPNSNTQYDSAVFLKAGSFTIGKDLGPDYLIANGTALCGSQQLVLNVFEAGPNTYQWYRNGSPVATTPDYTITSAGDYSVEVTYGSSGCVATGDIKVEYEAPMTPSNATLVQCDTDGDGLATFYLTLADAQIKSGDSSITSVTFYENITDMAPIANPTAYISGAATIYARSENLGGCYAFSQVFLSFSTNTPSSPPTQLACDYDGDGKAAFDLTQATASLLSGLPAGLSVAYYETPQAAAAMGVPLGTSYTNSVPFGQTIYARIVNGADCYGIVPVVLEVLFFNPAGFEDVDVVVCGDVPERLQAPSGYSSYQWNTNPPASSPSVMVAAAGTYAVTITDANGCSKDKVFTVTASDVATIDSIVADDFRGGENTVTITASGPGNYQYSLDGGDYVTSPVFMEVAAGEYTAYVRDVNGCGVTTQPFYVFDYPTFFTPNGDGFNDFWYVPNFAFLSGARISVFDRYGKLITAISKANPSWDGSYAGLPLPADDYWFVIEWSNGRNIRGHFALKR